MPNPEDECELFYPGLFQLGLMQPGKQTVSAQANERGLLFVFCQPRRLADDQERSIQVTIEDWGRPNRIEPSVNTSPTLSYLFQLVSHYLLSSILSTQRRCCF
jgi:hypothetical protein